MNIYSVFPTTPSYLPCTSPKEKEGFLHLGRTASPLQWLPRLKVKPALIPKSGSFIQSSNFINTYYVPGPGVEPFPSQSLPSCGICIWGLRGQTTGKHVRKPSSLSEGWVLLGQG